MNPPLPLASWQEERPSSVDDVPRTITYQSDAARQHPKTVKATQNDLSETISIIQHHVREGACQKTLFPLPSTSESRRSDTDRNSRQHPQCKQTRKSGKPPQSRPVRFHVNTQHDRRPPARKDHEDTHVVDFLDSWQQRTCRPIVPTYDV